VVTGYAGSVRAANVLKRDAEYSLDAVNAEDIGKFPNRNAAEALQLVPGVTMDRQRGEGLYVSIRGLGPQFQNVTLNGSTIAVNELIENGGAQGRYFRFEVLPTDAIAQLVVVKTPTADMDDGALGGNIDVKTLKPLDVGTKGALSARASYNDKRGNTDPSVSGFYSWANQDRTFGLLASAMYDKRSVRNDRFMNFGWNLDQFKSVLGTGLYTPTRTRPTIELEDRKRVSGVISAQWAPTSELKTEFNILATRLDVDYDEYGLDIYPDAAVNYPDFAAEKALYPSLGTLYDTARALQLAQGKTSYAAPSFVAGSQVIRGDTVVGGTINNVRWMASRETSLNRHDLVALNLSQSWTPGDWSFRGNYAYSKAHSYHPDGQATTRNRISFVGPLTFDFSGGLHALPVLTTTVDYNNPANYVGQAFDYTSKDSLDTDESFKFDASRRFDGMITKVAAGASYSHRNRDYVRRDWSINPVFGVPLTQLGSSYYSALPITDFLSDMSGASPRTWVLPSSTAFYNLIYNSSVAARAPDAASLRSSFVVDEKIAGGYVMVDFAHDIAGVPVSGDLGLRYAKTDQAASGTLVVGSATLPVTYSKSYDNVLPSLNLKAAFSDTLVGRFAASRVVTRPNIVDVAPRITVSRDSPTASGGNPNLNPFMATQIDLGLEWYFSPAGAVTGAIFYKKLDDFITQQNATLNVPGRGDVLLSTSANGGAVKLNGVELAYNQAFTDLPAPFDGLGTQASVTYVDISSTYTAGNRVLNDKLVGLSKLSYNLLLYYQKAGIEARIGYFWRDKYLASSGSTTSAESFVDSFGSLDGSIGYAFSDNLAVSLDGINLLGAKKYVYGKDEVQVREINDYGRTVTFSVRGKF
jgi:iron complex outermembrane receptor protein